MACSVSAVIGSGKSMTEARAVQDFDGVELAFIGDLTITQGDEERLEITGDDNILPIIETTVEGGILQIRTRPMFMAQPVLPLRYELTVKDLRTVRLSGLGNVAAEQLQSDQLELSLTGAGTLRVDDLKADSLEVNMTGLGDANVGGAVARQEVLVSGAGNYQAEDLRSGAAEVMLSGLGNAKVWVTERLQTTISGAGSVDYYGRPAASQTISGLGSIKQLGEK